MPTLLVIDDDRLVLESLRLALSADGLNVISAPNANEGLQEYEKHRPDVVLCDIRLPDASGLQVLSRCRSIDKKTPVILMTGYGTAETAIEAMRQGAFDYLLKPIDPDQLSAIVANAVEVSRLMRVPAVLATNDDDTLREPIRSDLLIGQSPAMQEVFKTIGRVAPSDATVLIRGETGTGKEMVARAIYHYSHRADKPFLAVNCAAIPENLLESELFGHEKGSFTGADRRRIGKYEQAHGGTLFLDEVGDMTLLTQAKILRVLQDGCFERIGGSETVRTDVRIIAATNRDLEAMMVRGEFREDLFYRLNICPIVLPPLRQRTEDILPLIKHFLRLHSSEFGKEVINLTPTAQELLTTYSWPGNVRQLQSVIKQAIVRSVGPVLTPEHLPAELRTNAPDAKVTNQPLGLHLAECVRHYAHQLMTEQQTNLQVTILDIVERELITEALKWTHGNLSKTSQILGIARPTLRSKMAAYGLKIESSTNVTAD